MTYLNPVLFAIFLRISTFLYTLPPCAVYRAHNLPETLQDYQVEVRDAFDFIAWFVDIVLQFWFPFGSVPLTTLWFTIQAQFTVEEQSGNALLATTPISLTASEPGPPGNTNGSGNALGMGMGRFLTVPGKSGNSNRTLGKEAKHTPKNQKLSRYLYRYRYRSFSCLFASWFNIKLAEMKTDLVFYFLFSSKIRNFKSKAERKKFACA